MRFSVKRILSITKKLGLTKSGGRLILPITHSYKQRVEEDGGHVLNLKCVNNFYSTINDMDYEPFDHYVDQSDSGYQDQLENEYVDPV